MKKNPLIDEADLKARMEALRKTDPKYLEERERTAAQLKEQGINKKHLDFILLKMENSFQLGQTASLAESVKVMAEVQAKIRKNHSVVATLADWFSKG